MRNVNTLWLINNEFRSFCGHYFNYNKNLYEYSLLNNIECKIIGNKELSLQKQITTSIPVEPAFLYSDRTTIYKSFRNKKINTLYNLLRYNFNFYIDLKRIFNKRIQKNDILFVTSVVTYKQILAWSWWLYSLPSHIVIKIIFMFAFETPYEYLAKINFKILETLGRRHSICIAVDSKRMAIKYSKFTNKKIEVFPIPLIDPIKFLDCEIKKFNDKKLKFVSLGNPRDDKGFYLLVKAIQNLYKQINLEDIEFILQGNNVEPEENKGNNIKIGEDTCRLYNNVLNDIKGINNVHIVNNEALDYDAYYRLLFGSDIVLLPYKRKYYNARSSGILIEAIAAGKPVIVTDDTWMSEELKRFGAGITFQDGNVDDLARAILQAKSTYPVLLEKAYATRSSCIDFHSPKNIFELLLK